MAATQRELNSIFTRRYQRKRYSKHELIKAYDAMRGDATPVLLHDVINVCRDQQAVDVTLEQAAKLFATCIDFRVEVDPRTGQHHIQRIILGKSDGG